MHWSDAKQLRDLVTSHLSLSLQPTLRADCGACAPRCRYVGQQLQVELALPQLNQGQSNNLVVTLEGQDLNGGFKPVGTVCSMVAGPTFLNCSYLVPTDLPSSDAAALPVFRLRVVYTGTQQFESATSFSDAFIIESRARLYSTRYASALLQESIEDMILLCNETATDNASAVIVNRACLCADLMNNERDCAGLNRDMLPAVRKSDEDVVTLGCNARINRLEEARDRNNENELIKSIERMQKSVRLSAIALSESIANDIKESKLSAQLVTYTATKERLERRVEGQRNAFANTLQIRREMVVQLDELKMHAHVAFQRLFATEGGLVADMNATRHAEKAIATKAYQEALGDCKRRKMFLDGLLGAVKSIAGVALIGFSIYTGNIAGAVVGGKLLVNGVVKLGDAFDFEVPGLETVDTILNGWPEVSEDEDRPAPVNECDEKGKPKNCATASVKSANRRNRPQQIGTADDVAAAIDMLNVVLVTLADQQDDPCGDAKESKGQIEQAQREILLVTQFSLASIALSGANADMQEQRNAALYTRRLPLVHLSKVKQATAMVGAEHFLEALFGGSELPSGEEAKFKEGLTAFRVSLEESSNLQVDIFQNNLDIRNEVCVPVVYVDVHI